MIEQEQPAMLDGHEVRLALFSFCQASANASFS
jgi:hypothetical protein